jgi:hypothetical protein
MFYNGDANIILNNTLTIIYTKSCFKATILGIKNNDIIN